MLKRILIALIIISISEVKAQETIRIDDNSLTWHLDFEKAKEITEKEKKPIFIWFTGSDWCSACILVEKEYFSTKKFKKISDEFVLFEADFPKKENKQSDALKKFNETLKNKYNIIAFPTAIIIEYNEDVLGRIVGYRTEKTAKIYGDMLKAILNSRL